MSELKNNGQITVRELLQLCAIEIKNGNGDKTIVIADDNEGNGYHGMFYGFTDVSKAFDLDDSMSTEDIGIYDTAEKNLENLIILG